MDHLVGWLLILTRVAAFFLSAPVFGWVTVPVPIRVSAAIILSLFFAGVTPCPANVGNVPMTGTILLVMGEATYGFGLGVIAYTLFSVVKGAGSIIEQQMGMNMAEILDPVTGEGGQPMELFMEILFMLLFLSAGGHHELLAALSKSFDALPVGAAPPVEVLMHRVMDCGSVMLVASLRLAAPIFAGFMVLLVVLAFISRLVPEMNILFISFPIRVGLGLVAVIAFLPVVQGFVSEFSGLMTKLLPF